MDNLMKVIYQMKKIKEISFIIGEFHSNSIKIMEFQIMKKTKN